MTALASLLARPVAPFLVAALAIGMFSAMDALMKVVTLEIGAVHAVFWRQCVSVLLAGALFFRAGAPWPGRAAWRTHVQRGLTITVAGVAFFAGLVYMPLADAIALSFIAPLLMVLMAAWLLGETIRPAALTGCIVGLAGVLIILWGQFEGLGSREALIGGGFILLSAVAYALAQVLLRKQASQSEPAVSVAFLQSAVVAAVLAGPVALTPDAPDASLWPWILASAVLATSCQFLLVWAYGRAQAQALAPIEYTAFLWASLFGWLLFKEAVTPATLAGAALIVLACVLAARK